MGQLLVGRLREILTESSRPPSAYVCPTLFCSIEELGQLWGVQAEEGLLRAHPSLGTEAVNDFPGRRVILFGGAATAKFPMIPP